MPEALRESGNRYVTERRGASFLFLTSTDAGQIPEPTEDELKTWYDANKGQFLAPELRSASILAVDPEKLAKPDAVSDEDVRKAYDLNKERYGAPEKRTIQQIVFPDAAAAEAARKEIEPEPRPSSRWPRPRHRRQGSDPRTLTRDGLFDKNVGDAAFALPEGGVSEPVQGRFGTVLLRVTKIEPGTVKPFEEVASEIRQGLALQRARDSVESTPRRHRGSALGGKSLAEIAADRQIALVAVDGVDAQGKAADGKPVTHHPRRGDHASGPVPRRDRRDNEPLRTKSNGYLCTTSPRSTPPTIVPSTR